MAIHGRRLDALWKLSTNAALHEDDITRALLTIAAAALRPGHAFGAHLLRVEADVLVVEETISRGPHAAWLPSTGATIEVAASVFRDIATTGGTRSCADVARSPEFATLRTGRELGARSFIGYAFRAGLSMYVVALVSAQALAEPFGEDDIHFVESLTTLLEPRLARRRTMRQGLMNCDPPPVGAGALVAHGSMP
jgi:hypothetical protein